jgi:ubiquinone/menaquinone biosynthesis C-methylase UbiE
VPSYSETNMHAQAHRSDPRTLGRRTLERDHRYLAALLRPGLSVLDVGCGSGAITVGIAKAVGPEGSVVGIDQDEGLLQLARKEHGGVPNLQFEDGDATSLSYRAQFDIVTAARTLQWISEPDLAISKMRQAAKLAGMLVVLDYNHATTEWTPDPPREFSHFYRVFLAWRQANHWDNEMADHLARLFRSAGLVQIESHVQDEVVERGEPEFAERTAIWSEVIESVGEQLAKAGFCTASHLREARACCDSWVKTELVKQTLPMRTVTGTVP